jgi:hypothetical protein
MKTFAFAPSYGTCLYRAGGVGSGIRNPLSGDRRGYSTISLRATINNQALIHDSPNYHSQRQTAKTEDGPSIALALAWLGLAWLLLSALMNHEGGCLPCLDGAVESQTAKLDLCSDSSSCRPLPSSLTSVAHRRRCKTQLAAPASGKREYHPTRMAPCSVARYRSTCPSTGSACFVIPTKPLPRLGSRLPPSRAPSRESLSRLLQLRGKSRRVLGKFASARSSIGNL